MSLAKTKRNEERGEGGGVVLGREARKRGVRGGLQASLQIWQEE